MIASCTKPTENEQVAGTWHLSGFTEVRAYRLNWEDEDSLHPILTEDGSLNSTRIPKDGIRLTDPQVARLEAAVTGRHAEHPVASCFYPHHAFAARVPGRQTGQNGMP